jgi:hypothetical protein
MILWYIALNGDDVEVVELGWNGNQEKKSR